VKRVPKIAYISLLLTSFLLAVWIMQAYAFTVAGSALDTGYFNSADRNNDVGTNGKSGDFVLPLVGTTGYALPSSVVSTAPSSDSAGVTQLENYVENLYNNTNSKALARARRANGTTNTP